MTIQEYNDIYKNPIVKSMEITSSGGVTITNTNICMEQMSLEESLCSENSLVFGACESGCFKIRIADLNHNFEGEWLTVNQLIAIDDSGCLLKEDGSYLLTEDGDRISLGAHDNAIPYGRFKVFSDKPTNDRRWRDLTCYDAMYDILNAEVIDWYNGLTFPMTMKNFRDSFFTYLGITQETTTLVNDSFMIQGGFSNEGSLSGKTIITSICELNGVFGHISRQGQFEYISLPSTDSLTLDWYMDGTGAYEDYTVQKITGIVAKGSDDDVGTSVGTDTNVYIVQNNPLVYGSEGTQGLTTALTNMLNNVKDITYRPFNVNTYGNPMLPLGTNLTISTRNQTINSFLMTRVLSGIQSLVDCVSANGEKYVPSQVNSLRTETKRTKGKIHEVVNDVDELRSTITDLEEEVESEIQQLSDTIVLKVDASGNIVKVALSANPSTGSTFAVNADNISFTAGSVLRFNANNIVIDSTNFDLDAQGNVTCNNLTATNADISGKITSTDGKIGNWNIGQNSIYSRYTIGQASYSAYMISESAKAEIFTQMQNSSFVQRASLKQGFFELGNSSGATMDTLNPMVTINCGIGTNKAYGYINLYDSEYYGGDYSKPITTLTNDGMSISANSTVKTLITKDGFKDTDFSTNRVLISDGNQFIDTSSITTTELGYLSGASSNIQTQLNGKQSTITGGATSIVSNNLTANKALVSNSSGKVAVSSTTATELGYVSGATSNIQGQIDIISNTLKNSPHNGFTTVGSVSGKYIDVDGVEKSNSGLNHTDYIEIPKWAKSVITYNLITLGNTDYSLYGPRFALYDSNKTWIQTQNGNHTKDYIISNIDGSSARYIIVNYGVTTSNINNSVCIFLPHNDESPYSLFDLASKTDGGYIGDDGSVVTNNSLGYTDYIEVPKWAKSVMTYNCIGTGKLYPLSGAQFATYDSNKTFIKNVKGNTDLDYVITDIDGKTVRYIRVDYGKDNVTDGVCIFLPTSNAVKNNAHIYGVEWDGSSTSKWTRTDSSRYFPEPHPAINNGNGYSPFDNIYPWAGMVRIEDANAGTLVSIPKFWYKWTRNGSAMKLQIADAPLDGFHVSPAHMDRGDGAGERDVVYVGRYHCASDYKSKTGVTPKVNETRSSFRTNIHALGSNIWQNDFAMFWTIRMLYLVEYADWNSQAKIGYGCGNGSSVGNMGYTDNMKYHTGTVQASRTTYGLGTQYRNIEGLWDNSMDWTDGIRFVGNDIYCIKNPSEFSDTGNGTNIGTRGATTSIGVTKTWTNPQANGFEYALFPSTIQVDSSYSTYSCDYYGYNANGISMRSGGAYANRQFLGLFCIDCANVASLTSGDIGSRLMVLP